MKRVNASPILVEFILASITSTYDRSFYNQLITLHFPPKIVEISNASWKKEIKPQIYISNWQKKKKRGSRTVEEQSIEVWKRDLLARRQAMTPELWICDNVLSTGDSERSGGEDEETLGRGGDCELRMLREDEEAQAQRAISADSFYLLLSHAMLRRRGERDFVGLRGRESLTIIGFSLIHCGFK